MGCHEQEQPEGKPDGVHMVRAFVHLGASAVPSYSYSCRSTRHSAAAAATPTQLRPQRHTTLNPNAT